MNDNILLHLQHLQKSYGSTPVLNDVSFSLERGHILGLIGKNGAGKTTLMKALLGLNTRVGGQILFRGLPFSPDDATAKAAIGSLVDVVFYDDLTARQNLEISARYSDLPPQLRQNRIREWLDFVGLSNAANKRVRTFSFGMKQRLALAGALLAEPALLILDEPFVGLDPLGCEETKALLRKLCADRGTAILFSSHQLTEVEDLADEIMVLAGGTIRFYDTYAAIKAQQASLIDLLRD